MTTTTSPPLAKPTPAEWAKRNLFDSWWSGLITVVLAPIILYLGYRGLRFLFVTGRWEAVQVNLTLFMMGTFPNGEQWRLIAQLLLFALAFGVGLGTSTASSEDRAQDAGVVFERGTVLQALGRMWSLVAFIGLLLFLASTDDVGNLINPFLLIGAAAALAYMGFQAGRLPRRLRNLGWLATLVISVLGFQVVSGFEAGGWIPLAIIFGVSTFIVTPVARIEAGWLRVVVRLGLALTVALAVRTIYSFIDLPGVPWDAWSGLHLTLMASAIAIVLAFPVGLLLALGRRSTFPLLRIMSTTYIEIIRGVPLITLLFMGQFILGFMVPAGTDLSAVTRAIAAMTMFSAAYVAEIVRGGLQSLSRGQTEAGQALGLPAPTIMNRIVLPQALRAVIPAMVGQFISLFKDSSLLFIIGILEFLGVRRIVHAQEAFRSVGNAETLVFVAIGYWAFAFAMSRESQRLERRLRVNR